MNRQFRKDGYVAIGRQLEHRIVYKQHFGSIPDGYDIHHKNGIRDDNRIENPQLLPRGIIDGNIRKLISALLVGG